MGAQLCRNRSAEWTQSTMSLRSEAMGTLLTASEDHFCALCIRCYHAHANCKDKVMLLLLLLGLMASTA